MADFAVLMKFRRGGFGWGETYYWTGTDPTGTTVLADARRLVIGRRGLLSPQVELAGVSIRSLAVGGSSHQYYAEAACGLGTAKLPDGSAAPCYAPWLALQVALQPENPRWRRQLLLRGAPDIWVKFSTFIGGRFELPVGLSQAFSKFRVSADWVDKSVNPKGSRWSMLVRGTGDFTALPTWRIGAVAFADVCNRVAVAVPVAAGFAQYDRIHIHGLTECVLKGVNGDHQITGAGIVPPLPAPPAEHTWWVTDKFACCKGTIVYKGQGTVYKVVRRLLPIAFATVVSTVERKTGRAAFTTKGRGKARKCCS